MNVVGIILGLLVAVVFYVVATAIIVFPHSALVFGLVALLIFLALAFGGVNLRGRL
jgi:uncharacterized protein YacL